MNAYENGREHLRDELRRLDLLLQRYLATWRAERDGGGEGSGLYISDAQVDRLLQTSPFETEGGKSPPSGEAGERTTLHGDPTASHDGGTLDQAHSDPTAGRSETGGIEERLQTLTEAIRHREREAIAAGVELPLVTLADQFGLERRHVDALLVALAPELDLKYETIYAYLQDDLTRKRPTVGLALRVVGGTIGSETDERILFTPDSPLLEERLLRLSGSEEALLSRPVTVDRRIIAFLLGRNELEGALREIVEVMEPDQSFWNLHAPNADTGSSTLEQLPVSSSIRDRLSTVQNRLEGDESVLVHLRGSYGSGRTATAMALADALDLPLLAADAERIRADEATEILELLAREVRLRDGAVLIRNLPLQDNVREGSETGTQTDTVALQTLIKKLDDFEEPVFLAGEDSLPTKIGPSLDHHPVATVSLERPDFDLRQALWEQVDLPGNATELASKFRFTPGEIEEAAATARAEALGDPTKEDVFEACRAQSREGLEDLARRIEPSYGWEDIVLPDDELRQLREVAAHIEQQGTVYSDWGFEDRFSLGTGVNVLFAGPSGTGKTMAAEIIAGETGLDLYKIDLANVVSKYIGETESNLGRIFDEAEVSNAVLFFDEADALFGERSEVSDAHDRYANVEVDYLLERMEEHDGVVLLATNLNENIDDAFQRRINVTVEFPLPDREARERIWRGVFPEATPVGDVDWAFLAGFDLTGGDIKNTALTAAFLAAEEGAESVEMSHTIGALWRELQKSDRLISRTDFGEYSTHINE